MLPRALLLDMDGTLTEPMLDFARIKAEMGIGDRPILESLAEMPPDQRQRAQAVLHRYEEFAAVNSTLNPGCAELLGWLDAHGVQTAVVTRNSLASARTVFARHHLPIDTLITRDDGVFKPSPEPLLLACRRLRLIEPTEAWMVGDGSYDIQAGLAAGMRTVWISHGTTRAFPFEPWRIVRDLFELRALLESLAPTR